MTFLEQVKPYDQIKQEWIDQCFNKSNSKKSKAAAELALKTFGKFLVEKYPGLEESKMIEDLKTIQHDKENYTKLYHFLNSFVQFMISKGNASRTIQLNLAMLKSFFRFNGIRIYNEDSKQFINIPKIIKERKVPITHAILAQLVKYANPEYGAFILFLASSGMRLGEGLGIRISDLDLSTNPVTIKVRAEIAKTREERITFITRETYESIKPLLSKRLAIDYVFFPERTGDVSSRVEMTFDNIRERAGLETRYQNGWNHVHIHALRSFFISQCERVHEGFGHALAGHGKYMKEYESYSDEQLREFYLKIEPEVTVSNEGRLKAENTNKDKKLKEMESMKTELNMMKDKVARLEQARRNDTLQKK